MLPKIAATTRMVIYSVNLRDFSRYLDACINCMHVQRIRTEMYRIVADYRLLICMISRAVAIPSIVVLRFARTGGDSLQDRIHIWLEPAWAKPSKLWMKMIAYGNYGPQNDENIEMNAIRPNSTIFNIIIILDNYWNAYFACTCSKLRVHVHVGDLEDNLCTTVHILCLLVRRLV